MEPAKKKILLVEDDTNLAAVYRGRLELEGFEVIEVNNGEDALSSAVKEKPDLILLDAMMPKISGFDVLDILRNTPETTNVRVIMLTALSQEKDKERAADLGVDEYLIKSQVVIGDVVARVKHHLGLPETSTDTSNEEKSPETTPETEAPPKTDETLPPEAEKPSENETPPEEKS